ncbi:LOW QUALITY PROTEIN: vesicle-associated membrane protein-associated protein A-like [Glossophaga mutica]
MARHIRRNAKLADTNDITTPEKKSQGCDQDSAIHTTSHKQQRPAETDGDNMMPLMIKAAFTAILGCMWPEGCRLDILVQCMVTEGDMTLGDSCKKLLVVVSKLMGPSVQIAAHIITLNGSDSANIRSALRNNQPHSRICLLVSEKEDWGQWAVEGEKRNTDSLAKPPPPPYPQSGKSQCRLTPCLVLCLQCYASGSTVKLEQILVLDPPTALACKDLCTDEVTTNLKLQNPSDRKVCFKVKTTAPHQYCVWPNSGIIDPGLMVIAMDPKSRCGFEMLIENDNLNDKDCSKTVLLNASKQDQLTPKPCSVSLNDTETRKLMEECNFSMKLMEETSGENDEGLRLKKVAHLDKPGSTSTASFRNNVTNPLSSLLVTTAIFIRFFLGKLIL